MDINQSNETPNHFPPIIYFLGSGILMVVSYYILFPLFYQKLADAFLSYALIFFIPLSLILIWVLVAYRREPNPWTWKVFRDRMRLKSLTKQDIWWMFFILILMFPLSLGLTYITTFLQEILSISIPIPGLLEESANDQLLEGNYKDVVLALMLLLVNILSEELFFRGIIFPRQEKQFKEKTWIIHGIFWWLFHAYKWFNLPNILASSLLLPWLAQKTQKTTCTMLVHFIANAVSLVILVISI